MVVVVVVMVVVVAVVIAVVAVVAVVVVVAAFGADDNHWLWTCQLGKVFFWQRLVNYILKD